MTEVGRYRIQSVAEMTGVSAATLRAWERRYGIPTPQRTASAYRLYSDRDVEMIRRVRELGENGIAPAQAVQMIQVIHGDREGGVQLALAGRTHAANTVDPAVQDILAGVQRLDIERIEAAVRHAMYSTSSSTLFERVFGPVLTEIGDRWSAGTLSIGQEHLVAEIIGAALRDMLRMFRPGSPTRTVVLACFADEEHVLPLLGVALALAEWNVQAVVLGARTPPSAIRHVVAELRPVLVGLSATMPVNPGRASTLLAEYADACGQTPWLVGGKAAGELREAIEACGGAVAPGSRAQLRATIDRLACTRAK